MILFFIFIGVILVLLVYSLFLFVINNKLPDMKFCNDEYDVNDVTFNPRNLIEDMSENVKRTKQ